VVQGDNCKPERESIEDKKKEESYIGNWRKEKGKKFFTQQNYQSAHEAENLTNAWRLRDFRADKPLSERPDRIFYIYRFDGFSCKTFAARCFFSGKGTVFGGAVRRAAFSLSGGLRAQS
jgi:hypothetical protein